MGLLKNIFRKQTYIVGKDIKQKQISQFYYTYSTTTSPYKYLRYHFYCKDNQYLLYINHKEGPGYDDSKLDIHIEKTIKLTTEQANTIFKYLEKGKVTKRKDSIISGYPGPWLYLYWEKDNNVFQQFNFVDTTSLKDFESFCSNFELI